MVPNHVSWHSLKEAEGFARAKPKMRRNTMEILDGHVDSRKCQVYKPKRVKVDNPESSALTSSFNLFHLPFQL